MMPCYTLTPNSLKWMLLKVSLKTKITYIQLQFPQILSFQDQISFVCSRFLHIVYSFNLRDLKASCQVLRNQTLLSTEYSQIFSRGSLEKDSTARNLPIARAVYSFLQDNVSSSFSFPGWNNSRIICQQSQLKQLLTASSSEIIALNNSPFNLPEAKISRSGINNDKYKDVDSKSSNRTGTELLTTTV